MKVRAGEHNVGQWMRWVLQAGRERVIAGFNALQQSALLSTAWCEYCCGVCTPQCLHHEATCTSCAYLLLVLTSHAYVAAAVSSVGYVVCTPCACMSDTAYHPSSNSRR